MPWINYSALILNQFSFHLYDHHVQVLADTFEYIFISLESYLSIVNFTVCLILFINCFHSIQRKVNAQSYYIISVILENECRIKAASPPIKVNMLLILDKRATAGYRTWQDTSTTFCSFSSVWVHIESQCILNIFAPEENTIVNNKSLTQCNNR